MTATPDTPIQAKQSALTGIVFDVVTQYPAGGDRAKLAAQMVKRLDPMINRLMRIAIARTTAKVQQEMIDALANDMTLVEETDEFITVKYSMETWKSMTKILDMFDERDELSALETASREAEQNGTELL